MADMQWRIYYGDSSIFSDEDGSPKDASPWNVQVIAQSDINVGRVLIYRSDYYLFIDNEWIGIGKDGLDDYLAHSFTEIVTIKIGRQLSRNKFKAILERANTDTYLPVKSGYLQGEDRD